MKEIYKIKSYHKGTLIIRIQNVIGQTYGCVWTKVNMQQEVKKERCLHFKTRFVCFIKYSEKASEVAALTQNDTRKVSS